MPRITHTPGKFRVLVGNFAGATDPSQNGVLGKPTRLMSGYEIQPLYFSGRTGTPFNLNGTSASGNIATTAGAAATASFVVNSATLTSTAYFFVSTYAAGNFNLTFSGSPFLAAPIVLVGVVAAVDANTTAANVKTAIDANPTLAALFTTVVQNNTPIAGQARVAIIAKKQGSVYNGVNVTTTVPGAGDFRILDASFAAGGIVTTRNLSGGTNQPPQITVGETTFEATLAMTGIAGYPVLANTTANQQAIATALATAISRIPQFAATAGGPGNTTVSITGPTGPDGGTYPFSIFQNNLTLFTSVTPSKGYFAVGAPQITGPSLS